MSYIDALRPVAGAVEHLRRFEGTPISRKNVPTYNPEGTFQGYITRALALEFVRIETADWRDDSKRDVQMRAQIHIPRGKLGIWVPKQSGSAGPLVLQYQ